MMKPQCRELEETLAPYVDGEATPPQCASVDAHLQACPPCRDRVEAERVARDAVRARRSDLRTAAPERLRAQCASHCGCAAASPRRRFFGRRAIVPLSLAATLLLAVAGAVLFSLNKPVEALTAQLAADHVKCFEFPSAQPVTDAPAAARRWSETRGWTIGVPPGDAAKSLELMGVRRCMSTDGTTAHLMYRWHNKPLSVYIMPKKIPAVGGVQRIVENLGHSAILWTKGNRTYLVMARGRPPDFTAIAAYIRHHVE